MRMRTASILVIAVLAACRGVQSDPTDTQVVAAGQIRPGEVAVGGGTLYFIEMLEVGNQAMYEVARMPEDGSDFPRVIAVGHVITALAADSSGAAYWIDTSVGA